MKLVKKLTLITVLFLFSIEAAVAWQPRQLIVFGDSLSDNGNKYQTYQIPISPPYWHGRYSNGPVWVEDLAFQFNLIPNPLLEPNYPRDLAFRNYAMGDAVAVEKYLTPNSKSTTLMDQLKNYQSETHVDLRDTLVVIWMGSNDFKNKACRDNPFFCTKEIIHTQEKFINSLYESGLRHFLILSLPNLAITPEAHEHFDKAERVVLGGLIRYYNNNLSLLITQLASKKDDLDIIEFDTNAFIHAVKHNFRKPLYQECYANHSVYDQVMGSTCPRDVQNQYLFWDALHPTAAAHALLANQAYDAINQTNLSRN